MECRLWEGLPGSSSKSVSVVSPVAVSSFLSTPYGVLLVSDGVLLLYKTGTSQQPKPLVCTNNLPLVMDIAGGNNEEVFVILHDHSLYKVDIKNDQAQIVSNTPNNGKMFTSTYSPSPASFLLDIHGRLYCKGPVPVSGNVGQSDDWQRVSLLEGMEVLQLVTGDDFTAALARKKETHDSPEDVNKLIQHKDTSCPLGLKVRSPTKVGGDVQTETLNERAFVEEETTSLQSSDSDNSKNCTNNSQNKTLEQNYEYLANTLEVESKDIVMANFSLSSHSEAIGDLNENFSSQSSNLADLFINDIPINHTDKEESDDKDESDDNISITSQSRLSYVTDLGKSVITNSLSLLTLSSRSSESFLPAGLVKKSGVKAASEPPSFRDGTPDLTWPRALRRSYGSLEIPKVVKGGITMGSLNSGMGKQLRGWQVYCWGQGHRGQLGQGDMLPRPTPSLVSTQGSRIVKLATGSRHCLALDDTGVVWGWGDNSRGQSVHTTRLAVVLHPTKIKLPSGDLARDITCSTNASLVLSVNGSLFVMGDAGQDNKSRLQVISSDQLLPSPGYQAVSVLLSGTCLSITSCPFDVVTVGLLRQEQMILQQTRSVNSVMSVLVTQNTALSILSAKLNTLSNIITYCVSLSLSLQSLSLDIVQKTGLYYHIEELGTAISAVHSSICDCIAADCLMLDSHQWTNVQAVIVETLADQFGVTSSSISSQEGLEQLLVQLFNILPGYFSSLSLVQKEMKSRKISSPALVEDVISGIASQIKAMDKEYKEADKTRLFWQSAGTKLEDLQREPGRRLLLDNRTQPISLLSRFSRHWLLLLSDLLVDVSGYSSVVTYSLSTVWLEVSPAPSVNIVLTSPEDSLTLSAPDCQQKTVWVQALQRAILSTLNKTRSDGFTAAPVSRTASYSFTKGDLKGAIYEGNWLHANIHGKGRMLYPDGNVHEGQWRGGERHGVGVAILGDGGGRQEGTWVRGKLQGKGRLVDSSGSVYEGWLEDGVPHGHGSKKEGKFTGTLGASVYIGDWVRGFRYGYGVLEDIMAGEKYMGNWVAGVKQGHGCVVNSDGVYYEGNFLNNRLCGGGSMYFEDGASFQGDFAGAGEFNGKGVLLADGRKYIGTFAGNYGDKMKFTGDIVRLADEEVTRSSLTLCNLNTADPDHKWVSVFNGFSDLLDIDVGENNSDMWDKVAISINQAKRQARDAGVTIFPDFDYLETIPQSGQGDNLDFNEILDIKKYISKAASCPQHPLCNLIVQLVEVFTASYGGVRSHPILLPHAISELNSFTSRLYKIVRTLFPALPPSRDQLKMEGYNNDEIVMTANVIIFPILLPQLHPTIFMLYALREQKADAVYWERILRWNKHLDKTLLIFLDVDSRFYRSDPSHHLRDKHFLTAINSLQKIKTTFTPDDKLSVVMDMFQAITKSDEAGDMIWSMDSLLPVCMYVVVRARVLQLGAELAMLQELMDTYLFQGEKGIMLTTLLAAYHQMLRESVFIN